MNLNLVTVFALLSWPVVAVWLYRTRPVAEATLWTILGAYLLLPEAAYIKIPMIPEFDKNSIPNFAAYFGCIMCARTPIRFWNRFGLVELLIVTLVISPFITSELNGDTLVYGGLVLPGVGSYDAGSAVIAQVVILLPFFIGRQVLRGAADTEDILRVLVVAGLAYSVPIFFELRMSPLLHTWIYGYFPGDMFLGAVRGGGFRPIVFLTNGLVLAFFMLTTVVAAAAFWRTGTQVTRRVRPPTAGITAYLSAILILCKTFSDLLYGAILVPLVRFTAPKLQARIALVLVTLALMYPMLRAINLVPTDTALTLAASISTNRAASLETRFKNEDQLLEHESQRFWFGWGRWGRNRVYNQFGENMSRTDGLWIITMGQFGFIGFLAQFGLLVLPVFRAASALRFVSSNKEKVFLAALTLILAINIFDLIPNAPLKPWTWLLAGALLGRAEALKALTRQQRRPWQSNLFGVTDTHPEVHDAPGSARQVQSHSTEQ
jgi:hypothetical protein